MINNSARIGNFTSSEIVALTAKARDKKSFGTAALTYIEETNMERRLCRSLTDEVNARPLTWGKLLEYHVFDQLGLEYQLISNETIVHPEINYWSGSPDGETEDSVSDIKCPLTLKSFCQLVQPIYDGLTGIDAMAAIRENHKDGEKFYWQLVSNAILLKKKFAELIVYMPYLSEIPAIKMLASAVDGDKASKHYWIAMALDDELPFLIDGGYYKNLNIIRFEVPESDKKLLTDCVLEAGKMLIGNEAAQPAKTDPKPEDTNALKI